MKRIFLICCLLIITISIQAQCGESDTTFNTIDEGFGFGDGASSSICDIAIQDEDKIIIGGFFDSYNGTFSSGLARLNIDGTLDSSFSVENEGIVEINSIFLQPDGKILIGGWFTMSGRNNIARLNADGSLDSSFDPGIGANEKIFSVVVQSDEKIVIGGLFTNFNGTEISRIARLNSDGSLDTSFNPGIGANDIINSIAVQNDEKIIIGGSFTNYNGSDISMIARLNPDGSLDSSFDPGTGANSYVMSVVIQNDGKIIIGGFFTEYNGNATFRIARLNSNGSLDTSFNTGSGTNEQILSVVVQSDGKIIICGSFTTYNGSLSSRIARLNPDGSLDSSFDVGLGATGVIFTSETQTDGKIILGGMFLSFNGIFTNRIARINSDGSFDESFNHGTGANDRIEAIAIQSNEKILLAGEFTRFNGISVFHIARLNEDGSLDSSFNTGSGANGGINTVSVQPDGKIIIGGDFSLFNGTYISGIARLNSDGSLDTTFNPGSGVGYSGPGTTLYSSIIQTDGKIIIGGYFSSYNGIPIKNLARLNSDGSLDNSFNTGTGPDYRVHSIKIQTDGKILIGGAFSTYNGINANCLVRLNYDGTLDESFDIGTGASSDIRSIVIQNDGKILIGGYFFFFNDTLVNNIARLTPNGALDPTFNSGSGTNSGILSIAIQSDGKIIIAGNFTTFNNSSINRMACLNPDGSLDDLFYSGAGANKFVWATAVQNDESIIIGGEFTEYNEIGRNRVCRITACPTNYYYSTLGLLCKNGTYNWHGSIYDTPGVYFANYTAIDGIDSIYQLALAYNYIDTLVFIAGDTIYATLNADSYQWVDCDNYFAPVYDAIYQKFVPYENGNYAVILNQGGCTDTSSCIYFTLGGIDSPNDEDNLLVYPVPITDNFSVELKNCCDIVNYELYSSTGQIIEAGSFIEKTMIQVANLTNGVYFIKLKNKDFTIVKKLIK